VKLLVLPEAGRVGIWEDHLEILFEIGAFEIQLDIMFEAGSQARFFQVDPQSRQFC
jgi:hypothetical protein